MVGKNNELNKSRHIFEHINRYSIRKFKVGVASVAIAGCFVLPMGTSFTYGYQHGICDGSKD